MRVSYRLWRLRARALEAAEACYDRLTPRGVGYDRYKPRLAPTCTPYGGIHTKRAPRLVRIVVQTPTPDFPDEHFVCYGLPSVPGF